MQTIDQRILNRSQSCCMKLQYLHVLLHSQQVMNHKQVWAPAASLEMFLSPMSAVLIGTLDGEGGAEKPGHRGRRQILWTESRMT